MRFSVRTKTEWQNSIFKTCSLARYFALSFCGREKRTTYNKGHVLSLLDWFFCKDCFDL